MPPIVNQKARSLVFFQLLGGENPSRHFLDKGGE
jgi:hypothetical protein